jgi:hypothetical protein
LGPLNCNERNKKSGNNSRKAFSRFYKKKTAVLGTSHKGKCYNLKVVFQEEKYQGKETCDKGRRRI